MNGIRLTSEIEDRYRGYLKSTFFFKDPVFRSSFQKALEEGLTCKGPFLEGTPVFQTTTLPGNLFKKLLGFETDPGFIAAVQGKRPLYWHQEEAITRSTRGENVVVATGTGSGKTEAFLYSILLHLYQEHKRGTLGPGIRALILYPLNALANDQRDRLGGICKNLMENNSPFRFSFGQYIGDTPNDQNDNFRDARTQERNRLPGELVFRKEMRESPPHILLTNYSMLEYLLLRPHDSPLFDSGNGRWWSFIVLDEMHQYAGTKGIEMAMLIRRLKQRVREGGRTDPFRCIGTSATLTEGNEGRGLVAEFASELFGEAFSSDSIVFGRDNPVPEGFGVPVPPEHYTALLAGLRSNNEEFKRALTQAGIARGDDATVIDDSRKAMGTLLLKDPMASRLRRMINGNPQQVDKVAEEVFGELGQAARREALADLMALLVESIDPETGSALLSVRFHFLIRSLEGAFASYVPEKSLSLKRKGFQEESATFEVALCRECGQHYFVGSIDGGFLKEAVRDPGQPAFGVRYFRPLDESSNTADDEDETGVAVQDLWRLCLACGRVGGRDTGCNHAEIVSVVLEPQQEQKPDQVIRCGACGYTAAGRDPVREILHGSDGPHSVIATVLYQKLSPERRKVLAFADGRQEAAYFAWYLEESYNSILHRNLLYKTIASLVPMAGGSLSLSDCAAGLREMFRREGIFPASVSDLDLLTKAWLGVYRELLTEEQRISLEGVGLVRWEIAMPPWMRIPKCLSEPPWSLTEQEARALLALLLDTMRQDKAVELRSSNPVPLSWDDLGLRSRPVSYRIGPPQAQSNVRSWDGERGRRHGFLVKLLLKRGVSGEAAGGYASNALREIWEAVDVSDGESAPSQDRLLVFGDHGKKLNPDWIRVVVLNEDDHIHKCDICGRSQTISLGGICPRRGCRGALVRTEVRTLRSEHYRSLYLETFPGVMRVEEHTAQIDRAKASEYQKDFKSGKIHVLSCSTTFELGVDLGDLDCVFLRNVPPELANYAQRVGRAGRRLGHPGLAITYCRLGPHDVFHFNHPERMLRGRICPPVLSVKNEKIILRHLVAVLFSSFFKENPSRFDSVQSLMGDMAVPTLIEDLKMFARDSEVAMRDRIARVVSPDLWVKLGIKDGTWVNQVVSENDRLSGAVAEVCGDYSVLCGYERRSVENREYRKAEWARLRIQDISGEDSLSFLSRKAVIPKYGFPVDVVELDIQRTGRSGVSKSVALQRDLSLAISEYAPTSKLIANKCVWKSHGLKRVPEKEWERWNYRRCRRHNIFLQWKREAEEPRVQTCCDSLNQKKEYIVPRFGFIADRKGPEPPKGRTEKVFSTLPCFAGFSGMTPHSCYLPGGAQVAQVLKTSPGTMVVLCEGRRGNGFYVCDKCGTGLQKPERKHSNPLGDSCQGQLSRVSLGHSFITDVLMVRFIPSPPTQCDPIWSAYSIAYALVEGASQVLGVPTSEVNATVYYTAEFPFPPIVFYDTAPGGAGLVSRLESENTMMRVMQAGLERVNGNCGCGEDTSCYGCLRNYRNQFAHANLKRGWAMRYLEELLRLWKFPA